MRKQLPFDVNVMPRAFPFYGNFFAILKGKGYNFSSILFNHYLNIYYMHPIPMVDYTECMLRCSSVRKLFVCESLPKYSDHPIEQIKSCINEGKYVVLNLNLRYLLSYQTENNLYHDYMIIGYDDDKQVFFLAGYWGGEQQVISKYCVREFNFTDVAKATPKRGDKELSWFAWTRDLEYMFHYTCCLPENFKVEPVNLKKLKFTMFLYAYKLLPWSFNLRLYSFFKYATHLRIKKGNSISYDYRMLKAIEEHTKIVLSLIETYAPVGSTFYDDYSIVVEKTNLMLNIQVKKQLQQKAEEAISRIDELLIEIKKIEEDVVRKFYKKVIRKL